MLCPAAGGGVSAAFAVNVEDTAQIVLVQEMPRAANAASLQAAAHEIALSIAEQHGLTLFDLVLVLAGTIPRTTSGKVQRAATKERWESLVANR
jgi:acyl-CoA synthetase (AMP-forming)/AMP-acid ligase II